MFRRESRRFGLHGSLRLDEFGKHIELRVRGHEQPVANEAKRQRDDHAARAQRNFNQSLEHISRVGRC